MAGNEIRTLRKSKKRAIKQYKSEQQSHSIEVFVSEHIGLRMLLEFSQPVNFIFWPIKTLNWLKASSKLHKHRRHFALLSSPTVHSLYCGYTTDLNYWIKLLSCIIEANGGHIGLSHINLHWYY